jgi:hypothetical protein
MSFAKLFRYAAFVAALYPAAYGHASSSATLEVTSHASFAAGSGAFMGQYLYNPWAQTSNWPASFDSVVINTQYGSTALASDAETGSYASLSASPEKLRLEAYADRTTPGGVSALAQAAETRFGGYVLVYSIAPKSTITLATDYVLDMANMVSPMSGVTQRAHFSGVSGLFRVGNSPGSGDPAIAYGTDSMLPAILSSVGSFADAVKTSFTYTNGSDAPVNLYHHLNLQVGAYVTTQQLQPPPLPVPEPGAFCMMLAGLGLIARQVEKRARAERRLLA